MSFVNVSTDNVSFEDPQAKLRYNNLIPEWKSVGGFTCFYNNQYVIGYMFRFSNIIKSCFLIRSVAFISVATIEFLNYSDDNDDDDDVMMMKKMTVTMWVESVIIIIIII